MPSVNKLEVVGGSVGNDATHHWWLTSFAPVLVVKGHLDPGNAETGGVIRGREAEIVDR